MPADDSRPASGRDPLESIVEQFERAWRAGERPDIDDFLPRASDRRALLIELAHADLELRLKAGEPAPVADYVERYPELAGEAADELAAAERALRGRGALGTAAWRTELPGRFGRFELVDEIGRGATGVVYRARDLELDRIVALKITHGVVRASAGAARRFVREASHAAKLRHPHIVAVHEVGQFGDHSFLVSDHIDGPTLRERLAGARFTPRAAAALVARVADALDHAHRHGVIHRDVKPSNILLDADGRPHLTDFGLARRVVGEATLTVDGQLLGTPAYMSPEQARGEARRVDARCDVYSLGVVLYELLTGEAPFRGSLRMVLDQVLDEDPRPPRRLDETIPRDLETVCLRAMAKEPSRRYATARAFAADLERFLDGRPVQARPLGPTARLWRRCRRRPLAAALAAALALSLAAGSAGIAWQWSRAEAYLADARDEREHARTLVRRAREASAALVELNRRVDRSALDSLNEPGDYIENALGKTRLVLDQLEDEDYFRLYLAQLQSQGALYSSDATWGERAVAAWRDVLDRLERRPDRPRDRLLLQASIAGAHHYLGMLHQHAGRTDDAIAHLAKSADSWGRVRARDGSGAPSFDVAYNRAYSEALLGPLLREVGRPAEAIPVLERAVPTFQAGLRLEPDASKYRVNLAQTAFHLGASYFHFDQNAQALRYFRLAAQHFAVLARKYPAVTSYRRDLAASLHSQGNVLSELGEHAAAVDAFRRAREFRAELVRERPESARWRSQLAGTERRLAEAEAKLGARPADGRSSESATATGKSPAEPADGGASGA